MRSIVTYRWRRSPGPSGPAVTSTTPADPAGSASPAAAIPAPDARPAGGADPTAGVPAGPHPPPEVRLGALLTGGLAPAILGIVDRGVRRRPGPARALRAEIELTIDDGYPPVRIDFNDHEVVVEDGPAHRPDARIQGSLTDLIALMVSPAVGGVPLPVNARGRAALGIVVSRRVRIEGSVACVRRMLALIRV